MTASRNAVVEDQPLLAAIVECAQDAIIGCSLDGTILSWNRAAEGLYGHPAAEAIGRSLSILEPAADGDELDGILARIGEPDRVARFDDAHLRADGTLVDVSVVVSPILDASGRIVGASVRACDVGEPERTEAKFRSLLDSALDAMVIVAGDGTIGLVNAKTEALFGYSREELVGEPVEKLVPERFRGRHRGHRGLYLVDPRARPMGVGLEPYGLHREGREFPLEMSLTPVKTHAGVVVLAAIRDLSERKASERAALQLAEEHEDFARKLVETQKLEALGVLAGGIAHDFNNLLGVILGNTSLALQTVPSESPLSGILEQVEQAARRSAELAKQMLAYSGKGMFVVQPVALSELVGGIAELIGGTISKKAVLTSAFDPDTPTIVGDVTQLRQVVLNLLTNASEALGDETGTIALSTGRVEADRPLLAGYELSDGLPAGRYAFLEVADSGRGMDAETRARLFEPFFSTKFVGRGLGLAAVQGIVRGHGGAIRISSEPGRGTSFKILFPAVAVEAEGTVPRGGRGPGLARQRDGRRRRRRRRHAAHGDCDARGTRLRRHSGEERSRGAGDRERARRRACVRAARPDDAGHGRRTGHRRARAAPNNNSDRALQRLQHATPESATDGPRRGGVPAETVRLRRPAVDRAQRARRGSTTVAP